MSSNYKLNFDFQKNEIQYKKSDGGHERSTKLSYREVADNPDLLNIFNGKDGYTIGTLFASNSLNKISVTSNIYMHIPVKAINDSDLNRSAIPVQPDQ